MIRKIVNCNQIMLLFLLCIFKANLVAQTQTMQKENNWVGSKEQKLFGLMTVWSEAKYNFPWFEKLPNLDWDAKVVEYIPKVLEAKNIEEYYQILMEFITLLKDGHTYIWPPWFPLKENEDLLAIELQIIDNKFIVTRVGDNQENKNEKVYEGLEIVEVDSNIQIADYFKEKVLKYNTTGAEHSDNILVWSIFVGERGSKQTLKVKDLDGSTRKITLTRNGITNEQPFIPRYAMSNGFEKNIESKILLNSIQYIRIPNFTNEGMVKEFKSMIENLDLDKTKGMIIDLRYNSGGNDNFAKQMISYLIENPISTPLIKTPQYIAAYRAWGKEMPVLEHSSIIIPSAQKKYLGPLVVLTGIGTASTAEDFAIEMDFSGRAILVGEKTAGSAGNPIRVALPGGGTLRVSTFKSFYPDGTEYMHKGVEPHFPVVTTQKNIAERVDPIIEKGIEIINNWKDVNKKKKKLKLSGVNKIYEILNNKNLNNTKKEINLVLQDNKTFYFLEAEFINLGYEYINKNEIEKAVELFRIATGLFPASWNIYDSYAEALMIKGDNELSVENYLKSIKLNPNNNNAEVMIKKIKNNEL